MAKIKTINKHALVPINYDYRQSDNALGLETNIANPFESLAFYKRRYEQKNKPVRHRFTLLIVPMIMIVSSVAFNGYFANTLDPVITRLFNSIESSTVFFQHPISYLSNVSSRPYVVTVGEFSSMNSAKEKAIELLPQMRQIDIIELDDGHYTFQVDRFSTEYSALQSANQLAHAGIEKIKITFVN